MAGSRTTFEKLQRDRAKKAKAEAKRAKRMGKAMPGEMPQHSDSPVDDAAEPAAEGSFADQLGEEISAADLLRLVEQVQKQFDNDEIDFEEYEERKFELLARLTD